MKKKKNIFARVMAAIALFAIIIGIVWTGVLVIVSSFSSNTSSVETEISSDELQEIIESLPDPELEISASASSEIDIIDESIIE